MSEFGFRTTVTPEGATTGVLGDHHEVAGLRIAYSEAGAGDPVLLIHRSTGPHWSEFAAALAKERCVRAPDVPGYGASDRPAWARSPAHLAVLLHRFVESTAMGPCHLVGLGFGGFLAAEMVATSPSSYASVTLIGAAGLRPRDGEIHDPMMESWTAYARRAFATDEGFATVYGDEPDEAVVAQWDRSREMTARVTWKPWMWSLQLPHLLVGVTTPAQIIWGGDDRIVPVDCAHQYAECFAAARLEVLEGAGHAVDLERPQQVAALVDDFIDASRRA